MGKPPQATSQSNIQARLNALQKIAGELISHKELSETLNVIVSKASELLMADAASLYIKSKEGNSLVFEVALNKSIQLTFEKKSIPITDKGIANYVFRSGEHVNIPDVKKIQSKEYSFDNTFDLNFFYTTKSILAYPLQSSKGVLLGVLQLINRKNSADERWPADDAEAIETMPSFTEEDADLLESFSSIASSAIENSMLYNDIENLFEGFVKASVHAIESRDPTTSGHSERVAALTVDLAEKTSRSTDDGVRDIKYSTQELAEIRYASLLHDFGKIAVKEGTLLKQEKLLPLQKLAIKSRFTEFKNATELTLLKEFIEKLLAEGRAPNDIEWQKIKNEVASFGLEIEEAWTIVQDLNLPTILNQDRTDKLNKISHIHCKDCEGKLKPLLEKDEIYSLSILKGSLTTEERLEIESHVVHTVEFLKKIPWTKKFSNVSNIAAAHHEKLNGRGYPLALKDEKIPLQARMMTICDIFDALVANDRPYKKALPIEKALDILSMEVKTGDLDARFFKVFVEAKSWEIPGFQAFMKKETKKAA